MILSDRPNKKALAIHLAADTKVVVCGPRVDKLMDVAEGNRYIYYYVADRSVPSEINCLFKSISDDGTQLDVLFHNSGVFEEFNVMTSNFSSEAAGNRYANVKEFKSCPSITTGIRFCAKIN